MHENVIVSLLVCSLVFLSIACDSFEVTKIVKGEPDEDSDSSIGESTEETLDSEISYSDLDTEDPNPLADLDEASLLSMTETLASDELRGRNEGTPESEAARKLIIGRLQSCGIGPVDDAGYEQSVAGTKCINVIGRVPGANPSLQDRNIMLSAHYDHVGGCNGKICNGAYDNAAAVAAVMEIACVTAKHPGKHPLIVALWDCEEPPHWNTKKMGSEYYANNPIVPLENISASIVLDLFGSEMWPGFNGLFVLGTESSDVLRSVVDQIDPEEGLNVYSVGLHTIEETPTGHWPFSDYDAFRNRQVPVIFVSDGTNKTYHQPNDDWEHIVPEKLRLETRYVFEMTRNVLNSDESPTWQGHPHLGADELDAVLEVGRIALGKTEVPAIAKAIGLNPISAFQAEEDYKALKKIRARLDKTGGNLTKSDIQTIRKGTQRLMCLAGTEYPEVACWIL